MTAHPPIVFRIEKGNGPGLAAVMGGFGLVGATIAGVTSAAGFWGLVAAAAIAGYFIGNAAKRRKCSGCGEPLLRSDESCPGCDGLIKGNIARPRDLPAAEAALKDDE